MLLIRVHTLPTPKFNPQCFPEDLVLFSSFYISSPSSLLSSGDSRLGHEAKAILPSTVKWSAVFALPNANKS